MCTAEAQAVQQGELQAHLSACHAYTSDTGVRHIYHCYKLWARHGKSCCCLCSIRTQHKNLQCCWACARRESSLPLAHTTQFLFFLHKIVVARAHNPTSSFSYHNHVASSLPAHAWQPACFVCGVRQIQFMHHLQLVDYLPRFLPTRCQQMVLCSTRAPS